MGYQQLVLTVTAGTGEPPHRLGRLCGAVGEGVRRPVREPGRLLRGQPLVRRPAGYTLAKQVRGSHRYPLVVCGDDLCGLRRAFPGAVVNGRERYLCQPFAEQRGLAAADVGEHRAGLGAAGLAVPDQIEHSTRHPWHPTCRRPRVAAGV
jgi:hypothetical protein